MKYYVKEFDTPQELADHLNNVPEIKTLNTGDNPVPAYLVTKYGVRRKLIGESRMVSRTARELIHHAVDAYYAIGQSWEDEAIE